MIIKWEKELGENNHKHLSPHIYPLNSQVCVKLEISFFLLLLNIK